MGQANQAKGRIIHRDHHYAITPAPVDAESFERDLRGWLMKQADNLPVTTLLAHTDDGVIWGAVVNGQLALSGDAFPEMLPPLRAKTLQQARLFGPQVELLIWRDGDGQWQARLIDDRGGDRVGYYFDEEQLQWGDHAEDEKNGFTRVAEGQQGLRHVVPLTRAALDFDPPGQLRERRHPLRLRVRQYVEEDEDGLLVVRQGRLVELWAEARAGGNDNG